MYSSNPYKHYKNKCFVLYMYKTFIFIFKSNIICLCEIKLLINVKLTKMSENVKKALVTLGIVMVALAVHQKFIAPMLVKKPAAPVK